VTQIQMCGWLVQDDYRRLLGQSARYEDQLLLSPGELPHFAMRFCCHPHSLKRFMGNLLIAFILTLKPAQVRRPPHQYNGESREGRWKLDRLRNDRNMTSPLLGRHSRKRALVNAHIP
jgi:hypothetical protein